MLRPPHTRYNRLFVYYLDRLDLPRFEHPDLIGIWVEDEHAILFFHSEQDRLVDELCRRADAGIIYRADLDYRDWEAGVEITSFSTESLLVRPVWEQGRSGDEKQEVVLDPGVVFGSGFHPTTRLCLRCMETLMKKEGQEIRRVADLGTGTGLLAIGAAKCGATHVDAWDINPLACEVARRNVRMNGCEEIVRVERRDLFAGLPDLGRYDLVIANLYKPLLVRLFGMREFLGARYYLISGIIPAVEPELLAALPRKRVRFVRREKSEIWRAWLLATGEGEGT